MSRRAGDSGQLGSAGTTGYTCWIYTYQWRDEFVLDLYLKHKSLVVCLYEIFQIGLCAEICFGCCEIKKVAP